MVCNTLGNKHMASWCFSTSPLLYTGLMLHPTLPYPPISPALPDCSATCPVPGEIPSSINIQHLLPPASAVTPSTSHPPAHTHPHTHPSHLQHGTFYDCLFPSFVQKKKKGKKTNVCHLSNCVLINQS